MGTLTVDRQPQMLQQFSNIEWNINEPNERKMLRSGLPARQNSNPFFFRNNPHPSRVRHIKGLLGNPVCAVMDAGYREGGSNLHNDIMVKAIRRNDEMNRKRETFVPGIGLVSLQPRWVEQLQQLTRKITSMKTNTVSKPLEKVPSRPATRPASRQSSRGSKTRLLEKRQMEEEFVRKTCSREADVKFEDAFSRKTNSREGKENADLPVSQWHGCLPGNIVLDENEANVADLLSQILKTDSLDVIKHWLMEAPEKEKEVVLEMIRAVSSSNLEFREVMNKLGRNPGGTDVEALRNEYEQMLDMKDIKGDTKSSCGNSSPRASSREKEDCQLLDVIKENLEADMMNSRRSTRSQNRSIDMLLPQLKRDDEEIEVLRSQLASRSSVNVFPVKTPSIRSSR